VEIKGSIKPIKVSAKTSTNGMRPHKLQSTSPPVP
jgi:hypothetical protein